MGEVSPKRKKKKKNSKFVDEVILDYSRVSIAKIQENTNNKCPISI